VGDTSTLHGNGRLLHYNGRGLATQPITSTSHCLRPEESSRYGIGDAMVLLSAGSREATNRMLG